MASLDLKFLLVYIRLLPKSTSLIIPVLAMKPWVSLFYCHPWDQVILWNSFQKSYFKSSVKLKAKQLHKKLVLSHSITTDHWRHTGFPRALKCYFEKWKVLTLERKHKKTEKPDPVRISVKRDGRRQPAAWRAEQQDAVCHGVPGWAVHLSKATEAEKDHSHPGVLVEDKHTAACSGEEDRQLPVTWWAGV